MRALTPAGGRAVQHVVLLGILAITLLDQKGVCAVGWAIGIVIVILMIPLGTWACSMGPDCGMGPIGYYMLGAFSGTCVLILFCALSIARKVAIEKRARMADQGEGNEKPEK